MTTTSPDEEFAGTTRNIGEQEVGWEGMDFRLTRFQKSHDQCCVELIDAYEIDDDLQ
jgi:hypothetical protein